MAVTYNFGKDLDADPVGLYNDIAQFFTHMAQFHVQSGITIQNFQLKPDGTVLVQTNVALPNGQPEHLGLTL